MDYIHDMLQELSSALDTDSLGEESADEEDKKEDVDEVDQAEQANLPHYVSRFKVSVVVFFLSLQQLVVSEVIKTHIIFIFGVQQETILFLSLFVSMLTARWQCCNIPFNIFRMKSNETGRH